MNEYTRYKKMIKSCNVQNNQLAEEEKHSGHFISQYGPTCPDSKLTELSNKGVGRSLDPGHSECESQESDPGISI